ncbi:MAG: histidine kinase [Cyclobacteriaceae bacterium]|nr:histidine kinase [Cyclobacteriaceae bacterium]
MIFFYYQFFHFPIFLAIADGLIYHILFAGVGLGLWYAVRYSQMETNHIGNLLVNHLTAVGITMALVLAFGFYTLSAIPVVKDGYGLMFQSTFIWRVLVGIIQYIIVVLVYYLMMYYLNFIEKMKMEATLKTNMKAAELNVLKSQINPHFLFNSLNSISALALGEPAKARDMIEKLSDFLRFSLSEKPNAIRLFAEEIDNINRYLDIEKIRFGDRLVIVKDLSSKCLDALIPSLILQPLVENAIKHGVSESIGRVEIRITADCFHGFLKMQVENDCEEKPRLNKSGSGIGLQNIKQRLKLVYGRDDLVNIRHEANKFSVILSIPQHDKNDTRYSY